MQKALFALGTAAVLLVAGRLPAQDQSYEADRRPAGRPIRTMEGTEIASPQYLLYQRAARKAEERALRLEARKWHGISAQRPLWQKNRYFFDFAGDQWHYSGYHYWPARY